MHHSPCSISNFRGFSVGKGGFYNKLKKNPLQSFVYAMCVHAYQHTDERNRLCTNIQTCIQMFSTPNEHLSISQIHLHHVCHVCLYVYLYAICISVCKSVCSYITCYFPTENPRNFEIEHGYTQYYINKFYNTIFQVVHKWIEE